MKKLRREKASHQPCEDGCYPVAGARITWNNCFLHKSQEPKNPNQELRRVCCWCALSLTASQFCQEQDFHCHKHQSAHSHRQLGTLNCSQKNRAALKSPLHTLLKPMLMGLVTRWPLKVQHCDGWFGRYCILVWATAS